jgi:putative membrane protein
MANERTMLAYLRTGLAMVIAGFSLIRFFQEEVYIWLGLFSVPFGVGIILLGWVRFRVKARRISQSLRPPAPEA